MSFAKLPELPDGVRYLTVKAAARQLGVDREVIEGLVIGKKILGYRSQGNSGLPVLLVDLNDFKRLSDTLREATP